MRVIQLQKITSRRYKVSLEDGMSFPLYGGEVRRYRILQDEEIGDAALREIMEEVLPRRAKLRCLNLLKNMDRTEGQLRERLSRDGYPEEIVTQAIAYAQSYRYVDDSRYAQTYVRQQAGKKSRRQIEADLMKRGIDREEIRQAFAVQQEEEQEDPDLAAIRSCMRRRHFDPSSAAQEERQKFVQYLLRRGFRYASVREALGNCVSDANIFD